MVFTSGGMFGKMNPKGGILMHKDTQEELKRLEAELLAEEEVDPTQDLDAFLEGLLDEHTDSLAKTGSMTYRNYANGYGDEENDEEDEVEELTGDTRKLNRLKFIAAGLLGGIAAVLIYWVVRFL
jgi:hypothetical protein